LFLIRIEYRHILKAAAAQALPRFFRLLEMHGEVAA